MQDIRKMNIVTKWLMPLLSLWVFESFANCRLNPDFNYVSLSGPISFLLEELKLLNDPKMKVVSTFHEVEGFKGERVGGGVFLSESKVKEWKNHVIFYDESRELEKTLKFGLGIQLVKIQSRGLDPFAATNHSLNMLKPYLKFCANNLHALESQILAIKNSLINPKFKKV